MNLSEYLSSHNISIAKFAEYAGFHRCTLGQYLLGKKKPTKKFATYIELLTKGACTFDEIMAYKGYEKLPEKAELLAHNSDLMIKTE